MGKQADLSSLRTVFAMDLGGTNIRGAAITSEGAILSSSRQRTPPDIRPADLLALVDSLMSKCREAIPGTELRAVGIGVPANVSSNGVLHRLPNLPTLEGFDLACELSNSTGLPVAVENDATAACIGEAWLGASRAVQNSILVTLGTGVGGGIILDGRVLRGPDGGAGKIGHICVEPDGQPCGCGSNGCIEQYASARALVRMAKDCGLEVADARALFDAHISGDVRATEVFISMAGYLGITLAGLINTLNPELIVIGGGVAGSFDAFIRPLEAAIRYRAFSEPAERAKVVRSELFDNAGVVGAARSALDLACNDRPT